MKKNKFFPKIKKKLHNFLLDESGKITRKDALGLGVGAVLFSATLPVEGHGSGYNRTNSYSHNITPSAGFYPTNAQAYGTYGNGGSHNNTATNTFVIMNGATCNHASGVVNGHFSSTPIVNATYINYDAQTIHSGHSNHSSHGSGGWC